MLRVRQWGYPDCDSLSDWIVFVWGEQLLSKVLKITNSVLYQVRIPSLVIIHLRVGPLSVGTLVLIRIDAVSINFQRPLKNETLSPVNRLFAQKNTVLEIV